MFFRQPGNRTLLNVTALAMLCLCWGGSFPAMRVLVESVPALLGLGTVFLTAGAALVAVRPTLFTMMTAGAAGTLAGSGLCLLGAQGLVVVAVQHLYAGTAAVLVASTPLWVAIVSAVLGSRRPPRAAVARVVIGFSGVCVVLVGSQGLGSWSTKWSAVVVGASIVWASGTYWASRATSLPSPAATSSVQLLVGGTALIAAGLARGELAELDLGSIDRQSWAAFAFLVLFDSLAGFALFNWLIRHSSTEFVSSYSYIVPIVAYVAGVVLLGESFSPIVLLGAVVILATVTSEASASHH